MGGCTSSLGQPKSSPEGPDAQGQLTQCTPAPVQLLCMQEHATQCTPFFLSTIDTQVFLLLYERLLTTPKGSQGTYASTRRRCTLWYTGQTILAQDSAFLGVRLQDIIPKVYDPRTSTLVDLVAYGVRELYAVASLLCLMPNPSRWPGDATGLSCWSHHSTS